MNKLIISTELKKKGIKDKLLLNASKEIASLFSDLEIEEEFINSDSSIKNMHQRIEPRVLVLLQMLEQLKIQKKEKNLIIGAESVYVLAVLSKICDEVYAVESNNLYVNLAKKILKSKEVNNVFIKHDDSDLGWKEKAPFDVILIANEVTSISQFIKDQLKISGRILAPVGSDWAHITFEILVRTAKNDFTEIHLRKNFFIPQPNLLPEVISVAFNEKDIVNEIKAKAISFKDIKTFPIAELLNRIGDAKVVLLGEASHGTSEFYLARQEITKALIEEKGFNFVCAEADWSDAEQINNYVRNKNKKSDWMPFTRFPQWMWKNEEVLEFVEWLKDYNLSNQNKIGFYGLDLYGLENSIDLVIKYLEKIDVELANLAKKRYSCITPFLSDPAVYGKMVVSKQLQSCEKEVLKMLVDLLKNKNKLNHSPEYFYAYQNANVVVDAERYYKAMYYGSTESWNLRDLHMFKTLQSLLSYYGTESKVIVWAHNSHIGNALATEMYSRGEINIGYLSKEYFKEKVYNIGFGTHSGTVAAAHNWGEEMKIMKVNPSIQNSYENLCFQTELTSFTLPLKEEFVGKKLRKYLSNPKLERAIGVIYRPLTERQSHYFHAVLPSQFDEYIWFKQSSAVTAIDSNKNTIKILPYHPFGFIDR